MNEWEDQAKQEADEPVGDEMEKQTQSGLFQALITNKDKEREERTLGDILIACNPQSNFAEEYVEHMEKYKEIFWAIFEEMERKEKEERKKIEKKKQKELMQVRRMDSVRLNVKDPPFHNFRVRSPRRRRSRR